jgi:hypothetical protein
MRIGLAALVFLLGADAARAQLGLPVEPFPLTTPDYLVAAPNPGNCGDIPYPPIRDGRRGHEANPSSAAESQRFNAGCPAK